MRRALALAMSVSACASSQALYLPDPTRAVANRYSVEGHAALFTPRLTFGPYTARRVFIHRWGSHRDPGRGNGWVENDHTRNRGSFELTTTTGAFHGVCTRDVDRVTTYDRHVEGVEIRGNGRNLTIALKRPPPVSESYRSYRCNVQQADEPDINLDLDLGGTGDVLIGQHKLTLATSATRTLPESLAWGLRNGVVLRDGSTELMAIDLSEWASVTLSQTASPALRDQAAAVATALLMLRDMR